MAVSAPWAGTPDLRSLRPSGAHRGGCLIVGEIAQTHDGSLGGAHALLDAIADAGADAVKLQTHLAEHESTPTEPWRVPFSAQDESRYAYWQRMAFSEDQWRGLAEHAADRDLLFLSSPFSHEAVALLDRLGMAAWKIASGEVGNAALLDEVAATGRPVLLSSGLSTYDELGAAVARVRAAGAPVVVLQCSTRYPCPPEHVGLEQLDVFRQRWGCAVGLSDHSATVWPSVLAAAQGAAMVEVHVALSRYQFGPDVSSSVTVEQLGALVEGVRFAEEMAAHPIDKDAAAAEVAEVRVLFTRSVVAAHDLPAGAVLAASDLVAKKPGTGLPADRLESLLGRRLARSVRHDQLLAEDDLEPAP